MMNQSLFVSIARRLMKLPTAPFYEELIQAEVRQICREHGLRVKPDAFGNLHVTHSIRRFPSRSMVLSAHMDHPGFEVIGKPSKEEVAVRFNGGVGESYFKSGRVLRLFPGNLPARLAGRRKRRKEFRVKGDFSSLKVPPEYGVWDLEAYRRKGDRIQGRACDDLIGVAVVLGVMIQLARRKQPPPVLGLLTRAEEVGFVGAMAAAKNRLLPSNALVISLETSKEVPPVKMGEGVIIRVGDRSSVFDSDGTRFLQVECEKLAGKKGGFKWQKALMGGGTCEGTGIQHFGYQTAAVCIALGNYHNCAGKNRIAEEFVSTKDALSMLRLLEASALDFKKFDSVAGKAGKRLEALERKLSKRLKASA